MIKYFCDEHTARLDCYGSLDQLVAEFAALAGMLYGEAFGLDPEGAKNFKRAMQEVMRDDSPVWFPPDLETADPKSMIVTMPMIRRDDGEAL